MQRLSKAVVVHRFKDRRHKVGRAGDHIFCADSRGVRIVGRRQRHGRRRAGRVPILVDGIDVHGLLSSRRPVERGIRRQFAARAAVGRRVRRFAGQRRFTRENDQNAIDSAGRNRDARYGAGRIGSLHMEHLQNLRAGLEHLDGKAGRSVHERQGAAVRVIRIGGLEPNVTGGGGTGRVVVDVRHGRGGHPHRPGRLRRRRTREAARADIARVEREAWHGHHNFRRRVGHDR